MVKRRRRKRLTDATFDEILANAKDITATYDVNLGGLPQDILLATSQAEPHLAVLRSEMEKFRLEPETDPAGIEFGLINMASWTEVHGSGVKRALDSGGVGAIDGTPVFPHQRYLTAQVFACAIGHVTSRTPLDLSVQLVKTHAPPGKAGTLDELIEFITEAELLTGSQSWPTAFMEYQERRRAKDCDSPYVIIDGPIVTQNLLTRGQGRKLFVELLTKSPRKHCVGVIKDISRSNVELRFYARALRPGELYVQETLYENLLPRLDEYGGRISQFVGTVGKEILRGVFMPGDKAFGFECLREDLPEVVSLLWLDRNSQRGYELPFLLAQVDALLRGRYRPGEAIAAIEATLAGESKKAFFDEINERTLR